MTLTDIRAAVVDALTEVAPEVDVERLDLGCSLREQVELDSMDFLFFLTAVGERTGVEVAEADYGDIRTLDECIAYVHARTPGPPSTSATSLG